jgi:anti-sigma B factor antagonist
MTTTVFRMRGEIDLANCADVEAALRRAIDESDGDIAVDCGEVTFMDSSAVAVLCRAEERMRAAGRRMHIAHASSSTRRLLELLGLLDRMTVDAE